MYLPVHPFSETTPTSHPDKNLHFPKTWSPRDQLLLFLLIPPFRFLLKINNWDVQETGARNVAFFSLLKTASEMTIKNDLSPRRIRSRQGRDLGRNQSGDARGRLIARGDEVVVGASVLRLSVSKSKNGENPWLVFEKVLKRFFQCYIFDKFSN